jgi:hypothetical protein
VRNVLSHAIHGQVEQFVVDLEVDLLAPRRRHHRHPERGVAREQGADECDVTGPKSIGRPAGPLDAIGEDQELLTADHSSGDRLVGGPELDESPGHVVPVRTHRVAPTDPPVGAQDAP